MQKDLFLGQIKIFFSYSLNFMSNSQWKAMQVFVKRQTVKKTPSLAFLLFVLSVFNYKDFVAWIWPIKPKYSLHYLRSNETLFTHFLLWSFFNTCILTAKNRCKSHHLESWKIFQSCIHCHYIFKASTFFVKMSLLPG